MKATIEHALEDIRLERAYQDNQWGGVEHDDKHTGNDWIAFVTAYLGPAAKIFWTEPSETRAIAYFRKMMVKVGALAVAAIQWADRKLQ